MWQHSLVAQLRNHDNYQNRYFPPQYNCVYASGRMVNLKQPPKMLFPDPYSEHLTKLFFIQ